MRGATQSSQLSVVFGVFQSTHPMRGATSWWQAAETGRSNFNPRTPCGVRPTKMEWDWWETCISIHAPHAGCDRIRKWSLSFTTYFNPRTPCGVRLFKDFLKFILTTYFNPRTPCGVRLPSSRTKLGCIVFQSTHPMRGATMKLTVTRK